MAVTSAQNDPVISAILKASYEYRRKTMIESDGRPLADPDNDDIDRDEDRTEKVTFSETVSYDLSRAVLMDDHETFDKLWLWASANMQRKNISRIFNPQTKGWESLEPSKRDHLFAWRFLPSVGGKDGGVLNNCDPAADADQDIAAALLMADKKWGSSGKISYRTEALAILNDIWGKETRIINGKRVLIAGDTQIYTKDPFTGAPTTGINISYFRPTYYKKLFAEADLDHNWDSMVAPCYEIIRKAERAVLHDQSQAPVEGKVNIVPDWIALDPKGEVRDHGWSKGDHGMSDYYAGGDAFRTLIWMALQAKLDPTDAEARAYCDCSSLKSDFSPCQFYKGEMNKNGTIYSGYDINGSVRWRSETLQTHGVYMAYLWASGDIEDAKKLYGLLQSNYNNDGYWGKNPAEYYGQNWVWFSLYLVNEFGGFQQVDIAPNEGVKPGLNEEKKPEPKEESKPEPAVEPPQKAKKIEWIIEN